MTATLPERFRRVLAHLDECGDDLPDVATLAALAAWSPQHFHRQFRALFGINVQAYAQQRRLARAAERLAFRDAPVGQIAGDAGYANAESFARAFRRAVAQSPSEFREAPDWPALHAAVADSEAVRRENLAPAWRGEDVRIVEAPRRRIALLMHRGAPAMLGDSLRRFIAWRRAHGLPPSRSATFNLLYDDPDDVAADEWRFGLACECHEPFAPADGMTMAELEGGRCAVLRHVGGDATLAAGIDFLYRDWLPRSGETPRDHPLWLQRLSFFPDVPEAQAVSEIWLPLCGSPPSGAIPRPTA